MLFYYTKKELLTFDLSLEARAEILEKISLFFLSKRWHQRHFEINWPLKIGAAIFCIGHIIHNAVIFAKNIIAAVGVYDEGKKF